MSSMFSILIENIDTHIYLLNIVNFKLINVHYVLLFEIIMCYHDKNTQNTDSFTIIL